MQSVLAQSLAKKVPPTLRSDSMASAVESDLEFDLDTDIERELAGMLESESELDNKRAGQPHLAGDGDLFDFLSTDLPSPGKSSQKPPPAAAPAKSSGSLKPGGEGMFGSTPTPTRATPLPPKTQPSSAPSPGQQQPALQSRPMQGGGPSGMPPAGTGMPAAQRSATPLLDSSTATSRSVPPLTPQQAPQLQPPPQPPQPPPQLPPVSLLRAQSANGTQSNASPSANPGPNTGSNNNSNNNLSNLNRSLSSDSTNCGFA
eukprot:gnl/Hemi2/10116_TR3506_c0_g1_i1.p1 gnl/Hemi2/10116_TR3506_c0_g1~~gnl/Hemi2/10116_TR3506_c0_g1_i1.p1  ORF type:complete len:259 (+),score=46.66 gnl/Hemi2/10116_TR3506_c0_g1_i1:128-904(+)